MRYWMCSGLAAFLLPIAGAAVASELVVAAPVGNDVGQWATSVSRLLDGTLRYPYVVREPTPTGAVSVIFRIDGLGQPTDIRIIRYSGEARLDRAAFLAVQRMRGLPPVPQGLNRNCLMQANIVFAPDQKTAKREEAAMRAALSEKGREVAIGEQPLVITVRYKLS